jgi:hypothetical protein
MAQQQLCTLSIEAAICDVQATSRRYRHEAQTGVCFSDTHCCDGCKIHMEVEDAGYEQMGFVVVYVPLRQ